jgi:hypothetical protein
MPRNPTVVDQHVGARVPAIAAMYSTMTRLPKLSWRVTLCASTTLSVRIYPEDLREVILMAVSAGPPLDGGVKSGL